MSKQQKGSGVDTRTNVDASVFGRTEDDGLSSRQDPPQSEFETGVVRWFNDSRGIGFIGRDNKKRDAFVHYSGIDSEEERKTLKAGQRVRFQVEEERKGPKAASVKVLR